MGRQRPPIDCELPFTYWVFGRPVSTRNDEGETPRALPAWRKKINDALAEAIASSTKNRGYNLIKDIVEVRVIWLSTDPKNYDQPDIDNMLKPLIDAFNKTIIDDDKQVHRILAEKGNINSPPEALGRIFSEVQEDEEYVETGEVIAVILDYFSEEYKA